MPAKRRGRNYKGTCLTSHLLETNVPYRRQILKASAFIKAPKPNAIKKKRVVAAPKEKVLIK